MTSIKNICCIGAGYVGGPTMAVIAHFCSHINVVVVDIDQDRIDEWNNKDLDNLPVYEPGLKKIIDSVRDKNLTFTTNLSESICNADMVFISVNTPIKKSGVGAGESSDLKWVESSARQISKYSKDHTIVVEKSTLPVRTAKVIKDILDSSQIQNQSSEERKSFSVLSNPEFLAEGTAIDDLINPDRVLIGGDDRSAINKLVEIYENWVPNQKIIRTNLWSSELSKLTANAFLAQRISSINSISAICESTGADVNQVAEAIGLDSRIGDQFLNAGPGFGGSCFKKDILNLVYLCKHYNLFEVARYWENIININSWQQNRIYELVVSKLFGNLAGKRIAILGFAFKANTNDTRESPSINICRNLLNEGANLIINDPKVSLNTIKRDLSEYKFCRTKTKSMPESSWVYSPDVYKSIEDTDAVLILTEWDIYKDLDWQKISNIMRKPAWVFDTRSIIDKEITNVKGLNFWSLGLG